MRRERRSGECGAASSSEQLLNIARALGDEAAAGQIREFLVGILTPAEQATIALRWQLVKMLARGMPQRQIAAALGISLCKITRGSRELKKGPGGFRKIVQRGLDLEGAVGNTNPGGGK